MNQEITPLGETQYLMGFLRPDSQATLELRDALDAKASGNTHNDTISEDSLEKPKDKTE